MPTNIKWYLKQTYTLLVTFGSIGMGLGGALTVMFSVGFILHKYADNFAICLVTLLGAIVLTTLFFFVFSQFSKKLQNNLKERD